MYQKTLAEKKKLKEENDNWKKIDMDLLESEYLVGKDMEIHKLKKENTKLKEEIKKLKKYETMIHNVWEELYWKDKYGEDVGWKDISNLSHYDEEFVKKEVVYEED